MKILIDMNLSPDFVALFEREGWEAKHWSTIGDPRASDAILMDWAREHSFFVLTHDLDFGAILAATAASSPSVLQIRAQDVLPDAIGQRLVALVRAFAADLERGALIVVDEARNRVRMLPMNR